MRHAVLMNVVTKCNISKQTAFVYVISIHKYEIVINKIPSNLTSSWYFHLKTVIVIFQYKQNLENISDIIKRQPMGY